MKKNSLLITLFLSIFLTAITVSGQVVAHQPDDILMCDEDNDGFAVFNLTQTFDQIILDQDPFDLLIYFYENQIDAETNVNAIVNDIAYTNIVNPQAIYVRVEHTNGEFDTTSFAIVVLDSPIIINPAPLEVCDQDSDGFADFILSNKNEEITGGDPSYDVTYHLTQLDADLSNNPLADPYENSTPFFETLYVRIENNIYGCYTTTTLDLIVNLPPEVFEVTELIEINDDGGVNAIFDLTTKIPEILNGQTANVTFFENATDANNNTNVIAVPTTYTNSSNPQTIYARLENSNSCYAVAEFELVVVDLLIEEEPDDLFVNEGDGDGLAIFDLTQNEAQMLGGQDPSIVLFTYYLNLEDSDNGDNNIINPVEYQNIANPQTIFVRLINNNTGSYLLTNFVIETDGVLGVEDYLTKSLILYPSPSATSITIQSEFLAETVAIKLINHQGQMLFNENKSSNNGKIRLDISHLETGVYFLNLISDEVSLIKRIVKQ